MKQLESDFERIINWNKYQPIVTEQKRRLDYLIDPSLQEVKRLFVLLFENRTDSEVHTGYFLPNAKDYSVTTDGRNFFDQTIKSDQITYDNIRKTATGQVDDYTPGCLLDYIYFKEHYKLIAIDLIKPQK